MINKIGPKQKTTPKTVFYDVSGKEVSENSDNIVAKSRIGDRVEEYRLMVTRDGRLFDKTNTSQFYNLHSEDRATKAQMFKFRMVPRSCFNNYLQFLKTGSKALLTMAERESNVSV
jgi:hypothetical protein